MAKNEYAIILKTDQEIKVEILTTYGGNNYVQEFIIAKAIPALLLIPFKFKRKNIESSSLQLDLGESSIGMYSPTINFLLTSDSRNQGQNENNSEINSTDVKYNIGDSYHGKHLCFQNQQNKRSVELLKYSKIFLSYDQEISCDDVTDRH
jgi:hypothetical protein